jgi:hypothetical protein
MISGGVAAISGTVASGQAVSFAGHGDLALYNLPEFGAIIAGFGDGDAVDLATLPYATSMTSSFVEAPSLTSGTLTVTNGGQSASLVLSGSYTTSDFVLSSDLASGTYVKLA